MEKDIALGAEGKVALKIEGGKVILEVDYEGKQASGKVSVSLDIDQYAALLKAAIPGPVDDTIIDVLVGALKYVP